MRQAFIKPCLLAVLFFSSITFAQQNKSAHEGFYIAVKEIKIDDFILDKIELTTVENPAGNNPAAKEAGPLVNVRLRNKNSQSYLFFRGKQVRMPGDSLYFKLYFPDSGELIFNGVFVNNGNSFVRSNNSNSQKASLRGKIVIRDKEREILNGIYDFTFLPSSLPVQSSSFKTKLEGIVISKVNYTPVKYCTVELNNPKMSTTTDFDGKFSFSNLIPNNSYLLTIRAAFYPYKDTSVLLQKKEINKVLLYVTSGCSYDSARAVRDIAAGEIRFLRTEGVMKSPNTDADYNFEKIYKIKYTNLGSDHDAYECIRQYNKVVVKYLDKKYGKEWRKTVRNDVIY